MRSRLHVDNSVLWCASGDKEPYYSGITLRFNLYFVFCLIVYCYAIHFDSNKFIFKLFAFECSRTMGVKGLHRYMCQKGLQPAIQEKFNIIEEIQKWKMLVFETWSSF